MHYLIVFGGIFFFFSSIHQTLEKKTVEKKSQDLTRASEMTVNELFSGKATCSTVTCAFDAPEAKTIKRNPTVLNLVFCVLFQTFSLVKTIIQYHWLIDNYYSVHVIRRTRTIRRTKIFSCLHTSLSKCRIALIATDTIFVLWKIKKKKSIKHYFLLEVDGCKRAADFLKFKPNFVDITAANENRLNRNVGFFFVDNV